MSRARIVWLLVPVVLAGCKGNGGGDGKDEVGSVPREPVGLHQPDWDYAAYKRVAVLPTQCDDARADECAGHVADYLATMLEDGGHFTVVGGSIIDDIVDADAAAQITDSDDPAVTLPDGLANEVQAVVVSRIKQYAADTEEEQIRGERYALDKKNRALRDDDGRKRVIGEEEYTLYTNVGMLAGEVRVIDTANGKVLFQHESPPIRYERSQREAAPSVTPEELTLEAARELAAEFCKAVAPYSFDARYKSDMLVTAVDFYRGEYEDHRGIPTYAEQVMLIVRNLPHQCERNLYTAAIMTRDGAKLVEKTFAWSPGAAGSRGLLVAELPIGELRTTGQDKFTAALYGGRGTNSEPLLDRDFSLDKAGE